MPLIKTNFNTNAALKLFYKCELIVQENGRIGQKNGTIAQTALVIPSVTLSNKNQKNKGLIFHKSTKHSL